MAAPGRPEQHEAWQCFACVGLEADLDAWPLRRSGAGWLCGRCGREEAPVLMATARPEHEGLAQWDERPSERDCCVLLAPPAVPTPVAPELRVEPAEGGSMSTDTANRSAANGVYGSGGPAGRQGGANGAAGGRHGARQSTDNGIGPAGGDLPPQQSQLTLDAVWRRDASEGRGNYGLGTADGPGTVMGSPSAANPNSAVDTGRA